MMSPVESGAVVIIIAQVKQLDLKRAVLYLDQFLAGGCDHFKTRLLLKFEIRWKNGAEFSPVRMVEADHKIGILGGSWDAVKIG